MTDMNAFAERSGAGLGVAGARLAVVKRAKAVVLFPLIAGLATLAIVTFVPDRYTASALIQIDPRQTPTAATDPAAPPAPAAFEGERLAIGHEIEALRSPTLIDRVAGELHLSNDPEFATRPLFARIASPLQNASPEAVLREAFAARLDVRRLRNSSLISIRFTSRQSAMAQRIANGIAAAYLADESARMSDAIAAKTGATGPTASEKAFASLLDEYGLTTSLSGARIVQSAQLPPLPSGPKRARVVALASASTLLLVILFALLLERDGHMRTRKVEKIFACPHMTSLPAVDGDGDAEAPARSARLIVGEPACRYAQAVRAACDELKSRAGGDSARVIMVTSALPGEGAELFASNIAHHLAVAGQTSLLADCDFHGKNLTRQLTPRCAAGLLDQIAGHAPVENVILRDSLTGVCFLPASGPAPIPLAASTALRSVEFSAAFLHLRERFPTIVVAAPPLLRVMDARALADIADQIVFVTAWHRTPRSLAKKALSLLDGNQRKVVGAVLADTAEESEPGFMSFAAMFDEVRRATRIQGFDRAA
jgi:Mrp family chromosome partitioning ATPase